MQLYGHQADTKKEIIREINRGTSIINNRKVSRILTIKPTGAGKTALFTNIQNDFGYTLATAHRRELVAQMSLAMAKWGMYHRIIAPKEVVRICISRQMRELNRHFYDPRAPHAAAAVDTLLQAKRLRGLQSFLNRVEVSVLDEGHHVLMDPINKWGRSIQLTPNAVAILGFTATGCRADGKGLGSASNGIFDKIIHGVRMRWLIENGYLKKYRVFNAQKKELNLTDKDTSISSGDYKKGVTNRIVRENNIIGDIVETYKTHAMGKRGITFAPSVEIAQEIAQKFNESGVAAMCLSDKTSDSARESALQKIQKKELLQLVNVDLFGEGFDLPAIECVSFARKTLSYGLYVQQFGRALRPTPGVDTAFIFDHVGNVMQHGLPDGRVTYDLEPTERHRRPKGALLARTCDVCSNAYERELTACPFCGWVPVVTNRSAPEFVEGDLIELDEETLNQMRTAAQKAVQPVDEYEKYLNQFCPPAGIRRNLRNHEDKIKHQTRLRDAITVWSGFQKDMGATDSIIFKRFYTAFGVDILSAQALNAGDACKLELKILKDLKNVII